MPMLIYIYTEFQRAEATFNHQRVYDSQRQIIVPLNGFTENVSKENRDINVGPDFDDKDIAIRICTGKIDPFTQNVFLFTESTNNNKTKYKRRHNNIGEEGKLNYKRPYWNSNTKIWSTHLPPCTMTDMEPAERTISNPTFKNLASNSWFLANASQNNDNRNPRTPYNLSSTIINDINNKKEKENAVKMERAAKRTKSEMETSETSETKSEANQNYNMNSGRAKKVYDHPVRSLELKIKLKDKNNQMPKLNQWFGTCRFVYNQCVLWCREKGYHMSRQDLRDRFKSKEFALANKWFYSSKFWTRWDDKGEDAALAMIKNKYSVPFEVWDSAIADFDKAYRAHLAKVKKNRERGKENDASNKCQFKFRSRKDKQESFEVRNRDFNKESGEFSFLFNSTKFAFKSKHKTFHEDGSIDVDRKGEFPLVYDETLKRWIPLGTIRVIRKRRNSDIFLAVPRYHPINKTPRPKDVVAMDPGVRTFMTTYDTHGFCSEWGNGDMKQIFSLSLHLDKMVSRLNGPDMANKHGKKARRRRNRLRKATQTLRNKTRNKIDEVHKKMSTWLCSTYKVILIPKFQAKAMSKRKGRNINNKTVRGMLCWSHYRFRQRLIAKSELFDECKVIECVEAYISNLWILRCLQ